MTNESFEKWLKENYLVDMSEFIVDEQERAYIKENNLLRKAWQAAKADSEQEIAELKNKVIEKCEVVCESSDRHRGEYFAVVCESSDRHRGEYFATKIRALKG